MHSKPSSISLIFSSLIIFFIVLLHQLIFQVSVQSHYLHEGASLVAQSVKILLQCRRPGFDSWVGKIPWRRKWQPTSVCLPGVSRGQRSLTGHSPWGHKAGINPNIHYVLFILYNAIMKISFTFVPSMLLTYDFPFF